MEDCREGGSGPLRPPTLALGNISFHLCPNPLGFLIYHFQITHETSPHCIFNKTLEQPTCQTIKSLLTEFELLQDTRWYNAQISHNVPFPNLKTVNQLPVSNTQKFYDPNIPVHLLNAGLNYLHSTFSRLITLMHSGLSRISLVAD